MKYRDMSDFNNPDPRHIYQDPPRIIRKIRTFGIRFLFYDIFLLRQTTPFCSERLCCTKF